MLHPTSLHLGPGKALHITGEGRLVGRSHTIIYSHTTCLCIPGNKNISWFVNSVNFYHPSYIWKNKEVP